MSANQKKFYTLSGVELKSCYGPEDLPGFMYDEKLGLPGQLPFTRGIREEMYRDSLWIMGQYSGFASPEEANERFRYLIEQGQTGFSIALDLPTQVGLDSDHPTSAGEVGKVGVAIDSLEDIETIFKDIDLRKVRQIRTTANANAIVMSAFFIAYARKNGIDPNQIGFFLQNDVLKEYICRGTYIFPPAPAVNLAIDVVEMCAKEFPNWTPISICGYHMREAGASAAQEIAFALANMTAYLDNAVGRGLDIDVCARRMFFHLASTVDVLEEVAKFRAARRCFSRLMQTRYGCKDPETLRMKIFCYTSGSTLTAEQPLNNIVRVTLEALSAVASGVQTLATSSYDEAFSIPTEEAATIALRTQQILAYESGLANTVDPFAGSYAVEALTDQTEKEIERLLAEIETQGGAIACLEKGYFHHALSDGAYRYQKMVDDGEYRLVGVNCFKASKGTEILTAPLAVNTGKSQTEKLVRLRATRDNDAVANALELVRTTAVAGENLGHAVVEAASCYATMGEICGVLTSVYGHHTPSRVY